MQTQETRDAEVDAVITWVDGSDPRHAQTLRDYLKAEGLNRPSSLKGSRLLEIGELEYCVVSILRYAPWIRYIYIVSDQQQPAWLGQLQGTAHEGRVRVVDHREIFKGYERCLPTFNIRSIMSMIYRIPGLSERFIFFNDDFVLLRAIAESDFFKEGKVVLRGQWKLFPKTGNILKRIKTSVLALMSIDKRAGHVAAQERSARLAGLSEHYLRIAHNPHPWRRSTYSKFVDAHPALIEANIAHRFRSNEQFISECLVAYLEIVNDCAEIDNRLGTMQFKPADQSLLKLRRGMASAEENEHYAFACIQGLADASKEKQAAMLAFLDRQIGSLNYFLKQSLL